MGGSKRRGTLIAKKFSCRSGSTAYSTVAQLILHHHAGQQGDRARVTRQQAQHGHVVHLRQQAVADAAGLAHQVEAGADLVVGARQQERNLGQFLRKPEYLPLGPRAAHQADRLTGDPPAAPGLGRRAMHPAIGQHQVQRMHPQPGQQVGQAPRTQDHFHIVPPQDRCQEILLEVARQGRHRADAQHLARIAPAIAQQRHQFGAAGKDGVGIGQGQATGFGQYQGAAPALEQRLPELLLELPDLCRQGRLRDMQMLRRTGQMALLGHGPEVMQMVVVQAQHRNIRS
jgi:hypothetical protein